MKAIKSSVGRRLSFVAFAGLIICSFSSCLKDRTYPNPPIGALSVVQAVPDEPPLNFFLNNNLVNNGPMLFGDFVCYFRAYAGLRTANFDNAGTMAQILSDTITIKQNQSYSLFMANVITNPQYLFLTDTLSQPPTGNASIRFINLGPDAGAVDFVVQNGNTSITNRKFLGYSSFTRLTAGTYTLQVNQAGTNTTLATLSGVTLFSGGIYTIWLQGLKASTNTSDKLSINSMRNAQF